MSNATNTTGTDVAKTTGTDVAKLAKFTDDELNGIKTVADAFNAAEWEDASEVYGTGFDVLDSDNKMKLVKVAFIIIDYAMHAGDMGEFVSLTVVTETNDKYIVNDGSTGICDQMRRIIAKRAALGIDPHKSLAIRKGLRVSEYDYTDDKGFVRPAKTFYLDI